MIGRSPLLPVNLAFGLPLSGKKTPTSFTVCPKSDKWEQGIYVVVDQAGDLPVYTVKPECCDGPKRTLHRDLLLPCGFLPAVEETYIEASPVSRPTTRQQCEIPPDSEDFT